ncbi:MAG TPA: hypothetical protein VNO21_11275 [Polyangiaceae bacterium]|nr:hypothetical protein [Polyangiaceae bacterium]
MTNDATNEKIPTERLAFILDQPAELTAKQIVEKAKAAGVTISTAYVYQARRRQRVAEPAEPNASTPRSRGKRRRRVTHESAPKVAKTSFILSMPKASSSALARAHEPVNRGFAKKNAVARTNGTRYATEPDLESSRVAFAKLALEIGLREADALLAELRAKIQTLLD